MSAVCLLQFFLHVSESALAHSQVKITLYEKFGLGGKYPLPSEIDKFILN